MQGTYTITEARQGRTYENKKGPGNLTVWYVALENARAESPDGSFELHKKEDSDPPKVGDLIDVEKSWAGEYNGDKFVRIKQVYNPTATDGRGVNSDAGGKFDRRREHPRNEARMIHTSALSATPGYIEQMLTLSLVKAPQDEDEFWKLVGHVATRLTRSYERAMEPAGQESLPVQDLPTDVRGPQDLPADTAGLNNGPAKTDASIPFRRLPIPDREARRRDLFTGDKFV